MPDHAEPPADSAGPLTSTSASRSPTAPAAGSGPRRELSLFDSTCLIVGIIVGAGIYQTAPDVARGVGGAGGVLIIWILGGLLSLCGALGYAELATAYPRQGGDYVYLTRAYGPWAGFLFGWAQLLIVRPGDIAVMAFVFGTYAHQLGDPLGSASPQRTEQLYALAATFGFTLLHVLGVRQGKLTQNLLTVLKTLGLLTIVALSAAGDPAPPAAGPVSAMPASIALILVLFTYGGWNEMAYVAAEVREPRRNIVRALVLGTSAVMALYVLVNFAFLHSLGYAGVAASEAVAVDTVRTIFPRVAAPLIAGLICVSTLGALNGLIFTGARISYAVGADHRIFGVLGRWDSRTQTPVRALVLQGAIAAALIVALGSFLNALLYTAATVYSFYLATTLAVMVLRRTEPGHPRPYRMAGYPFTPLIFSAACVFLVYSAILYKPAVAAWSCLLLAAGLLAYSLNRRFERRAARTPIPPTSPR